MAVKRDKTPVIHPGEVLRDFLTDYGITQYRLAKDINVPPRRINQITHGDRGISVDTAIRLSKYFGNSARFWLNAQQSYELAKAEADHLPDRIEGEITRLAS